jgi:hypothetical protein
MKENTYLKILHMPEYLVTNQKGYLVKDGKMWRQQKPPEKLRNKYFQCRSKEGVGLVS